MKDRELEVRPAGVSGRTKQAGEIRSRWAWVEPTVWTEQMLTALEEGVKGGRWFSLIDKVTAPNTLRRAYRRVKVNKGAAGVDHETIERFEEELEGQLSRLQEELRKDEYRPRAIRRVWIPKLGSKEKRPIGIPTVRDRVVQAAVRMVVEPIYEKEFAEQSYGFRPNRGCKDALRRVDTLMKGGYTWVVDADLKSYFDTIPHEKLIERVEEKIADGRVIELIRKFLKQEVMETAKGWTPEGGTPQGAVLSPLLSNIYLNPLDWEMSRKGIEMVRYADDFVILCRSKREAEEALGLVKQWTEDAGLTLHPEKTRVVDVKEPGGFDFLGYHFELGKRWPRKKSMKRFRDTIRAKTRRTEGRSLTVIINDINRTTRGWFEYYKHSHKYTFSAQDSWIRGRLRTILRKRDGGKGRGRGSDHQRWPNVYFAEHGMFSLSYAHAEACRSSRR